MWWLFNIQNPTPDLTPLSINSRNAHKYSNNCFSDSTHQTQLSKEEGKVVSIWRMKHRKSTTSLLLMTWMQIMQFFSAQAGPLQSKTLLTWILKPPHTRKSLRTMQDMLFVTWIVSFVIEMVHIQLPKETHRGCDCGHTLGQKYMLVRCVHGFMGLFSPFLFLPQKNERKCCHWEIKGGQLRSLLCFKENSQMYTLFYFLNKNTRMAVPWMCSWCFVESNLQEEHVTGLHLVNETTMSIYNYM